jgi:hypothetical protein
MSHTIVFALVLLVSSPGPAEPPWLIQIGRPSSSNGCHPDDERSEEEGSGRGMRDGSLPPRCLTTLGMTGLLYDGCRTGMSIPQEQAEAGGPGAPPVFQATGVRRRLPGFDPSAPVVTTTEVNGITGFWAFAGGTVMADGGSPVTSRGVCWSSGEDPTVNDHRTVDGLGIGAFTSCMSNLAEGTPYTARAYATNEVGTGYGAPVRFTTLTPDSRLQYLGQPLPGRQFVRFAPGVVPEDMYHSVTVSPDGQEIYWAALTGGGHARLMVTRMSGSDWATPEPVAFAGRPSGEFWDDAPVVSPDNRRLFFTSRRPVGSTPTRWWYMVAERTANGWSAASPLPDVISAKYGGHWGVSVSWSGTVYFEYFSGGSERIFYSALVDGQYTPPAAVHFAGGADSGQWYAVCPFVAPDDSYLIFNRVENGVSIGYYISFRGAEGEWLAPVRLTAFPSPSWESTYVTRDGKYVFCKSYWASAELIEELRPR